MRLPPQMSPVRSCALLRQPDRRFVPTLTASFYVDLSRLQISVSIDLLPDDLFNLADPVLNFADVLFSPTLSFQVGVVCYLPDCFLDCSFDFVELACCFVVRARFH